MPVVQFGWPDPDTIHTSYTDDPDLFWVTRDYRDKLRAARRSHPAVVFMGDSCTEFGSYPERTLEALRASNAAVTTGMHVAAGGWSSEQGVAQLERDILPLRPRVIVVYYGWNDHWMALGPTDPELRALRRLLWLAERSRLVQLALKARMVSFQKGPRPNRVPSARYLHNLEEIARLARRNEIVPILVTAAENHSSGHEPPYLLKRHVGRLSDVIPLHQQYEMLTRQAARESGAFLCDVAAEFNSLPDRRDIYFRADGIHFTDAGDRQLGDIVSRCIMNALR